jgi:hypothetical protein
MPRAAAVSPRTPDDCDEPVIKDIIAQLSLGLPFYVAVSPQESCEEGRCFWNVERMIELSHGGPIYGWCIWDWPGYYARAEHHCIWQKPDGTLVDPTPKSEGDSQILFLPDPNATPESVHPVRRSVWVVEGRNPDNLKLVELSRRSEDLRYQHHRSCNDKEKKEMVNEYWRLEDTIQGLIEKIGGQIRLPK